MANVFMHACRFEKLSNGTIEFRFGDIEELSKETCLDKDPRFWGNIGRIPQQTKSDGEIIEEICVCMSIEVTKLKPIW